MATDGAGNWVAVWKSDGSLEDTIGKDLDILVARSADDGATWTDPSALSANAASDTGDDLLAQVTTDGAGNWVAVWKSEDPLTNTLAGSGGPPDAVNGVSGTATDVSAGDSHGCGIQAATGNVVCWGSDSDGQATPPDAVNGVSGTATDVSAGYSHSCAVQATTGNVVCWGSDLYGKATPPDAVNGVSGTATDVSAGDSHSCAVQATTGNVVCWGRNNRNQATPPDAVNGVSGTATDVSAGGFHSCALQTGTGNVVCWGWNVSGQTTSPDAVNGVSGTAIDVSAGYLHSCAVQAGTRDVVCWGSNNIGSVEVGQATPPDAVNGVSGTAIDVSAGVYHSCAVQADTGDVICWGSDARGQTTPPDAVNGVSGSATGVSAGGFHSCALQASTGNVVCWDTIGEDADILIVRSTDDGATWTPPAALNGNALMDQRDDWNPQVTTDGTVWVAVWNTNELFNCGTREPLDQDIVIARSTDAGATWSMPAALTANGTECPAAGRGGDGLAQVTTDGAGNWVAVWRSFDQLGVTIGADADILVARSANGGATWTYPVALNTDALECPDMDPPYPFPCDFRGDWWPQVTTDGAGNWVAVWQAEDCDSEDSCDEVVADHDILVARSTDNGATWTDPAALNSNAATDAAFDGAPQVTTDGTLWVAVWESEDSLSGTIGNDLDILVSRSTDAGENWTAAEPLNTNAATDSGSDGLPQVTLDSAGNWVAVWHSADSLGDTIGEDADILVAFSDDGVTWTDPVALNTNAASDVGSWFE